MWNFLCTHLLSLNGFVRKEIGLVSLSCSVTQSFELLVNDLLFFCYLGTTEQELWKQKGCLNTAIIRWIRSLAICLYDLVKWYRVPIRHCEFFFNGAIIKVYSFNVEDLNLCYILIAISWKTFYLHNFSKTVFCLQTRINNLHIGHQGKTLNDTQMNIRKYWSEICLKALMILNPHQEWIKKNWTYVFILHNSQQSGNII